MLFILFLTTAWRNPTGTFRSFFSTYFLRAPSALQGFFSSLPGGSFLPSTGVLSIPLRVLIQSSEFFFSHSEGLSFPPCSGFSSALQGFLFCLAFYRARVSFPPHEGSYSTQLPAFLFSLRGFFSAHGLPCPRRSGRCATCCAIAEGRRGARLGAMRKDA